MSISTPSNSNGSSSSEKVRRRILGVCRTPRTHDEMIKVLGYSKMEVKQQVNVLVMRQQLTAVQGPDNLRRFVVYGVGARS